MTPPGEVLVFLEDRFEISSKGVYTRNPALAGSGWREYLPSSASATLVARARRTESPSGQKIDGELLPLPHYVGVLQTLRSLLRTRRTIHAALDDAAIAVVKTPGVVGTIASRRAAARRIPLVVHVVGDASGVLRSGVAGRVLQASGALADRLTAKVVRRADLVRYVPAERLRRRYPPSDAARVHMFSDVVVAATPQWVLPSGPACIVSVGSVDQVYKGQHLLIRALPVIRESLPSARLRLIGGGRMLPELRRLAVDLGVEQYVEFTGFISDKDELHRQVADASLFVLPSLTEGLPRALVEAMALGVPAIASRVGGVPDLLPPESSFDAGDVSEMIRLSLSLLTNKEALVALSNAGIEAVRPFDADARARSLGAWKTDLALLAARGTRTL